MNKLIWVINASPLILLGKLDRLDLLEALGTQPMVPQAVLNEIAAGKENSHEPRAASYKENRSKEGRSKRQGFFCRGRSHRPVVYPPLPSKRERVGERVEKSHKENRSKENSHELQATRTVGADHIGPIRDAGHI